MICDECGISHGDLYVRNVDGTVFKVQSDAGARLLGYEGAETARVHRNRCLVHQPEPTLLRMTR